MFKFNYKVIAEGWQRTGKVENLTVYGAMQSVKSDLGHTVTEVKLKKISKNKWTSAVGGTIIHLELLNYSDLISDRL